MTDTNPETSTPTDDLEPVRRTRVRTRRAQADADDVMTETPADPPAQAPADEPTGEGAAVESPAGADDVERVVRKRRTRQRPAPAPVRVADDAAETDDADTTADTDAEKAPPKPARKPRAKAAAPPLEAAEPEADEDEAAGGDDLDAKAEDVAVGADGDVVDAEDEADVDDDADDDAVAGEPAASTEGGEPRRKSRRRRGRGRRGRGRGGAQAGAGQTDADTDDDTVLVDEDGDADVDEYLDDVVAEVEGSGDDLPAPTRLQARARTRTGTRGNRRGRATTQTRGRRPYTGVSEETRRTINEGPPRRMMVTVGADRTQIAVLEERTLVEHYVTRRSDVSYVGNIYMGRVQNVLPGMEAAFVDIGKGRNGVLYAGEVNYDEADLETDLPRIEQTLKQGQSVLVQVTKDPMGTKGARLTQHLSIAGRYCVLAPGDGMLGISRKLADDERERLRKILKTIKPEGFGLIVRTAAEGATAEQLEADVQRLVRIWEQVNDRAQNVKPLESVYTEPDLVIRVIRDVFGPEYTELIVDSQELADEIRSYLGDVSPELVDRVKVHEGDDNIFDAYEITNQIRRALEKKVWLKSGGYLIVEKTEAMWVIDVNTGKFVGERNLEETVLKNNIEAAVEIARQLRLRDMGGIIVIDFVDMLVPANRDEVLKRFKRELARDKTKSRVMEISKLGLVQMTRKNVSQGLQESFTSVCDVCEGRGRKIAEKIV